MVIYFFYLYQTTGLYSCLLASESFVFQLYIGSDYLLDANGLLQLRDLFFVVTHSS